MKSFLQAPVLAAIAICITACASSDKAIAQEARPINADAPRPTEVSYSYVVKPAMVTPEEWGSEPDNMDDRRHTPKYLTIHHSGVVFKAGTDPAAKVKNLQTWGKAEKGWPDVPYHYLIAPDGTIFEARSTEFAPETNTKYDVSGHIGIDLMGNFEEQRVSKEQLQSLVHLLAWLGNRHSIDLATISGHRDVAPGQTVCPGADLHRYITGGQIYEWAVKFPTGQAGIELLPPMEDGPTEFVPTEG